MSEWKEYKLGELGKIVTGKTPPTSQHQNYDGDIPFICIPDLGKSRFIFHTNKTISKIGLETVKNCSLPKGSVVVSCIATIGQVGITTKDISVTNQQINSLIPDSNLITEEFCYYYFKNLGEDLAQFGGGGSIFEIISKDKFSKVYLTIPSLPEQTAIASVLSSLDDKIDLLHRQNATLEKMGETLFRQWFVEDAKEEWKEETFEKWIHETVGGDWGKESIKGDFTKAVYCLRGTDIADLNKGLPNKTPIRFIKENKYQSICPNDGDLIIEVSGGTENQSTGRICYIDNQVKTLFNYPLVFSNFCRMIRIKKLEYSFFVYCYIQYLYNQNEFFNLENGSSGIKNLDYKTLLFDLKYKMPDEDSVIKFHNHVKSLFQKVNQNKIQIRTLSTLRDTLLPKLMSGEIKV